MLVQALLEGANRTAEYTNLDVSMYTPSNATALPSYGDYACESLHRDIYKVMEAYYISDIIGEVQVIKEGANPEILLENIITSGFEKLKEIFKKFLAKIKEWFKKIKEWFKTFWLSGKEFTKEFGQRLRKKASSEEGKDYKYSGYKFTISKGKSLSDNLFNECEKAVNLLCGNIEIVKEELSYIVDLEQDALMEELYYVMERKHLTPEQRKEKRAAKKKERQERRAAEKAERQKAKNNSNDNDSDSSDNSDTTNRNTQSSDTSSNANNDNRSSDNDETYKIKKIKKMSVDDSKNISEDWLNEIISGIIDADESKSIDKSPSEIGDEFCSSIINGADSISEANTIMRERYRDDEESQSSDLTFSDGNSVDEMINIIENLDKKVSDVDKKEREFEKIVNNIIKTLNKMASNKRANSDKDGDKGFKAASKMSSIMNIFLTIAKNACGEETSAYKDFAKQSEAVLKAFIRKGGVPLKEGIEVNDSTASVITEGTNIFDMAYSYLR